MHFGRILHITVYILLAKVINLESARFNTPRLTYSSTLKPPSGNFLGRFLSKLANASAESFRIARTELLVRDINNSLSEKRVKLLIVLELSDLFKRCNNTNYNQDGSEVNFSDNDKVLLPPSFFEVCKSGDYHVPFQLILHKVHVPEKYGNVSNYISLSNKREPSLFGQDSDSPKELTLPTTKEDYIHTRDIAKECVSCSSIEFRTDENYIYVPKWILKNLNLKPYDVVLVEATKLDDCSNIELKCLDKEFYEVKDIKKVLEERLKYYSTLTLNSVIPITFNNTTYNFKVLKLDTHKRQNVTHASIQDVDLNVKLV